MAHKVAMILPTDFNEFGYYDVRVYKEARSLIKVGYHVKIFCRNGYPEFPKEEIIDGIEIMRISQNPNASGFEAKMGIFKTAQAIYHFQPDIIHAHDLNPLLIGVIGKLYTRKPLIYDSHEDNPLHMGGLRKYIFYRALALEKILINYVDAVITVNETLKTKLERYGRPTYLVMNCREKGIGVVPNTKLFHKYGINNEDFLVIYIGTLSKGRNLDNIVLSAKSLDENTKIMIVGDGPLKPELEKQIISLELQNKVILTGAIPSNEVVNYASSADVGLIIFEPVGNNLVGSPNKLFEYMLAGIPIIASNFPVMRQIITEADSGILINPNSNKELIEAIKHLKSNPSERIRFGDNGKNAAMNKYNWEVQERTLLELYSKII